MTWITKSDFETKYKVILYYRLERISRTAVLKKTVENRRLKYDEEQLLLLVTQDINLYISSGRIKGDLKKDIQAWNKRVPEEWKIDEDNLTFRGEKIKIKGESQRWVIGDDFDIIFEYYKTKSIDRDKLDCLIRLLGRV